MLRHVINLLIRLDIVNQQLKPVLDNTDGIVTIHARRPPQAAPLPTFFPFAEFRLAFSQFLRTLLDDVFKILVLLLYLIRQRDSLVVFGDDRFVSANGNHPHHEEQRESC